MSTTHALSPNDAARTALDRIEVYEDNAGGLYLLGVPTDDSSGIVISGMEQSEPGEALTDCRLWSEWVSSLIDEYVWTETECPVDGMVHIATYGGRYGDELHVHDDGPLGRAGRRYLGLDEAR